MPENIGDSGMTELGELATMLHETFLSLVAAGFTEQQALYMTVEIMKGSR